jgi:hypothetical protein
VLRRSVEPTRKKWTASSAPARTVICRTLIRCKLRPEVKRYRPALKTLRQFVHQEIRRLFRRISRSQMHNALGHHLIADCLPLARLVDEYKRIYTVILFIRKAIRRTHRGKGRRHGRMARREHTASVSPLTRCTPARRILEVRLWGQSGKHLLSLRFSDFDPE